MQHSEDNPWKIKSEKLVYENPWISLIHYDVINPSGGDGIYGKVHFKNLAIGIIAVDDERNTYLIGQFRFTINEYSWEIPEGGCPHNEDPLEAAKRELQEETGFTASHWQFLGEAFLSNSVSDEKTLLYLATGLTKGEAAPEETELLHLKKISLDEAFEMANDGRLTDAVTLLTLQKLQLLLLKEKLSL